MTRKVAVLLLLAAVGAIATGTSTARNRAPKPASCGSVIDERAAPRGGANVLFDRVALWPEDFMIPMHGFPQSGRLPWFGKQGVEIKAGTEPVDLIVPPSYRGRVAIGWGDARAGSRVRIAPCSASPYEDPPNPWFAYAGGFAATEPLCLPLVVHVGDHRAVVPVAVGKPCPPWLYTFTL